VKVLVVENYDNTTLGLIGDALLERAVEPVLVRAHHGEALPDAPDGFDGMVILGGAQSAVADDNYPYLPHLARLVRAFGDEVRAGLGICLGSQVVARAYGGENILDCGIEFGYRPVTPLGPAAHDPVLGALEAPATLFHWHHDTVTLPDGAVHLASSEQTPVQAFRMGERVYGIQLHFEASRRLVADWSERFSEEIVSHAPDWPARKDAEIAAKGAEAERVGLEIARRWVRVAAGN
jgi:GMP synthase (glutamine-hydrolysing)